MSKKRPSRFAELAKAKSAPPTDTTSVAAQIARVLDAHIDLSRKDVKAWRTALEACMDKRNPLRYELYDMYDNYAIDPYLQGQMTMRTTAVLSTPFFLQDPQGNHVHTYDHLFQSAPFFDLIQDVLLSRFYGYTLLEFLDISPERISYEKIPYRNILPSKGIILLNPAIPTSAVPYTTMQNVLPVGKKHDIGLLNNVMPHLIWKRHAEQAWSGFMERFGTPLITAETSRTQQRDLDFIDQKLRDMGQNLSAVFPLNTKLNILQPANTDAFRVFDERIKQCNQQMAVMLTLSATLSDISANRSQSEVHERNFNEKVVQSDMRMFAFWVNDSFIPMLRTFGIPIPEGVSFVFDSSYELSNQELQQMTLGLMNRYDIDPEWLTKTFGIPILGERTTTTPAALSLDHTPTTPPTFPHACCSPLQLSADDPDPSKKKRLQQAFDALTDRIAHASDPSPAQADYLAATHHILDQGLRTSWIQDLATLAYDSPDRLAYQAMEINLFRFSAAKSIAAATQINALLLDQNGQRTPYASFKAQVDKLSLSYNSAWLQTEYNHATAVGQNVRNYLSLMTDIDTHPYVMYQTAGDSKVRTAHQILNGKILNLKDPEARVLNPPNGFNCRCEFVPYTDPHPPASITSGAEAVKLLGSDLPPAFRINYADARTVFQQNQFYTQQLEGVQKLNDLSYRDYDLPDHPTSTTPLQLSTKSVEDIQKEFKQQADEKQRVFYTDYKGRALALTEANFSRHILGEKYEKEQRHLLWEHLTSVLQKPDEVYLNIFRNGTSQMTYVKYYKDSVPLIVVGQFDDQVDDLMKLNTWFKNDTSFTHATDKRIGILIRKSNGK